MSFIWALLLLIPLAAAGPVPQKACFAECRIPANAKFQHAIAKTYVYDYQAASVTSMISSSEEKAELIIKGQVLITFHDRCNVELSLRKTSIDGLNEQVDISELEARPVMLSWQDGVVESVCVHDAEPVWAANIKRAVASMLQHTPELLVSKENVVESDIIGRCPTNYTVEQSRDLITVVKTKVPNQCSSRVDRHSVIPSVAYLVPAEIQSIPLMNSSSICSQQILAGVFQQVVCEEQHIFRPLANQVAGAKTVVSTSLSFVAIEDAVISQPAGEYVTSELLFDARGLRYELLNARSINSVVRSICQTLASDKQSVVSQHFTELVYALRKASAKEVKDAYNNVKGSKMLCSEKAKTEKLFLDALPQAGTVGTITLMADLLKKNEIPSRQAVAWYMSLPLAKYATVEAIKPLIPLIETVSESPIALLGVSGLVRRVCKQNAEECLVNKDIKKLSAAVHQLLGDKCLAEDEIRVLSALKAFGNMGVMTQEVQKTVIACAKNAKAPTSLRLAAIDASRRNPCQAWEHHMDILTDKSEDNEVRIAAYMSIMRCPTASSLVQIQDVLAAEEDNHVANYIITHMSNLESSSTPAREHARRLIKKFKIDRSLPKDLRRYSRNMIGNYFNEKRNAGWEVDANVIYSAKSVMPRSASFNMSLDLFGQSFNLLEVGARAENLERVLEAYLGKDERQAVELTEKDALKIDAFVRVFGSEIAMYNYRGVGEHKKFELIQSLQGKISKALKDLIKGAQKVNIDVARSLMFLDTTVSFPTVAGFPVRLALNGTTTIGLGMESDMDVQAILKDPRNASLKLKLNPLAVSELAAAMSVDIGVARTGVKLVATIHSSMAADISAKTVEGSAIDVKFELPKSNMTVIDIKSEMLLVQQNTHKKMKIANEIIKSYGGCSERLSPITGLRLCAKSVVSKNAASSFPLSGNAAAYIVIEKIDPEMMGYSFLIKSEKVGSSKSVAIVMDTIGAQASRKLSVKALISKEPTLSAKIEAKSPWGQVLVESQLVFQPTATSVEMKMIIADREYMGKILLIESREAAMVAYSASVEGQWPGQQRAILFKGILSRVPGSSLKLSIKPTGPLGKLPWAVDVTMARTDLPNARIFTLQQLNLVTPLGKVALSGDIGRNDKTYLLTVALDYGRDKEHSSRVNIRATEAATSPNDIFAYAVDISTASTRFPALNMNINWKSLVSSVSTTESQPMITYSTSIEGQWPGQSRAPLFEGSLVRIAGNMLKLSLKPAGPFAELPYSIECKIVRNIAQPAVHIISVQQLEMVTPLGQLSLTADIGRSENTKLFTVAFNYGAEKQHSSKIDIRATDVSTSPAEIFAYTVTVSSSSTRFPALNINAELQSLISTTVISNTLNAQRGENTLAIKQFSSRTGVLGRDYSLVNQLEVVYPKLSIDFKFNKDIKIDERSIKAIVQLAIRGKQLLDADIALVFAPVDASNIYELTAKIVTPRRSIILSDVAKMIAPNTYAISPVLELTPGGKHQLSGQLSFVRSEQELRWSIDSELSLEGLLAPMKVKHMVHIVRSKSIYVSNLLERNGEKRFSCDATVKKNEDSISVDLAAFLINRIDGRIVASISREAGLLDMDLNLIRLDRHIKLNMARKMEASKASIFLTVAWDADRDVDKKLSLEIVASLPGHGLDLQAVMTILAKRYAFTINALVGEKLTDIQQVNIIIEHPSGMRINLSLNKVATVKNQTVAASKFSKLSRFLGATLRCTAKADSCLIEMSPYQGQFSAVW